MFSSNGKNSVIARTKTAPPLSSNNDSARFAVVSCASWEHGYFNAYENISDRNDVDAVLHLGDYIYEYETGGFADNNVTAQGRTYDPPGEAYTQLGYQLRYSQYKLDNQLRRIHQLFPFITVWDDHETCNDSYRDGGENHQPATEGLYSVRKKSSTNTYFNWMPIRKPDPLDTIRIFRKVRYGNLLDLIMLDTRLYDRDVQDAALTNDPNHHMMGPVERAWYFQQLADTTTRWKIIGNQVMFAPMKAFGQILNKDQWDGYNSERDTIINQILTKNYKNLVILTGDIHTSWCNDVPGPGYNSSTGAGSVCVEFVGPSVTSLNFPIGVGQNVIKSFNPHEKYVNLDDHGYYLIDVKKGKVQADYKFCDVTALHNIDRLGPSFYVNNNERFLRTAASPALSLPITAPNPPLIPNHSILPTKVATIIYVTTDNKTTNSISVIPNAGVCPALSMTIYDQANHGVSSIQSGINISYKATNGYKGNDTILAAVCSNGVPSVCDTVRIFITVNAFTHTDTITVNLEGKQTYADCFSFDDITKTDTLYKTNFQHSSYSFTNDTCFTATADSNFCGFDEMHAIACDKAVNVCDTVIYIFKINHPSQMQTITIDTVKNVVLNDCFVFDDLIGAKGNTQILKSVTHGNFTLPSDSCLRFSPYYNYIGKDTVILKSCDNCTTPICDTIQYIFNFKEVIKPSSLAEVENLIVFGIYPNPFEDHIMIQYYLQKEMPVKITVTDMQGRIVSKYQSSNVAQGLNHSSVKIEAVPEGMYVLEIEVGKEVYRKTLQKQ